MFVFSRGGIKLYDCSMETEKKGRRDSICPQNLGIKKRVSLFNRPIVFVRRLCRSGILGEHGAEAL
jgi:hypothetical protein